MLVHMLPLPLRWLRSDFLTSYKVVPLVTSNWWR